MFNPPIKGNPKKKLQPIPDLSSGVGSVVALVGELSTLKQDILQKNDELSSSVSTALSTVDQKLKEVTETMSTIEDATVSVLTDLKSSIKNGEDGKPGEQGIEGKPGAAGKDADEEKIVNTILTKIPQIKIDEKALIKKVVSQIPTSKASLKIIQENIEIDPMSVIDKIMALPIEKRNKLRIESNSIDGLKQTMDAFQTQLGRGYIHGGGDTVAAGTNITITTNASGAKVINSTGGGGSGTVSSVSVVSTNGFAGTVATATTTPAITISTIVTGVLKGNGTAISAAVSNTDYQAPIVFTTTRTKGAAKFYVTNLNIPVYAGGVTSFNTRTGAVTLTSGDITTALGFTPGIITSVSGTTNRITSTGGSTPVIDISATFEALLGKVASPLSQFAATTSAQLAGVISDETGSGLLVFGTSPSISGATLTTTSVNGVTLTTGGGTTTFLNANGAYSTPVGSGTVTSVATNATLTGGPITTTGTLGIDLSHANTWTGIQTYNYNTLGTTPVDALILNNTTAAANNAQQASPALHFSNFGWGTTAGTSQAVDVRISTIAIQSTVPVASTLFQASIAGGAYATFFTINSNGNFNSGGTVTTSGAVINGTTQSNIFGTTNVASTSNFGTASTTTIAGQLSTASLLFGGAANTQSRVYMNGTTNTTLTANASYTNLNVGIAPVNMAGSGTHAWIVNAVVNTIGAVGGSGATITNTASLFVGAASAAGTNNYSLYVNTGNTFLTNGNITLGTAGNKINITTGTNASAGVAALSGGTVTVSTTAVTASSLIFLTDATTGSLTNVGNHAVGTIVAGTSFVINSTNVLDASNVNWLIIN